ncbi:MAG: hypothetical protein F6K26_03305 [Moorea sp. SIO2I5]|nr:hypothetical protein [Moorena sp. SIO2I5]
MKQARCLFHCLGQECYFSNHSPDVSVTGCHSQPPARYEDNRPIASFRSRWGGKKIYFNSVLKPINFMYLGMFPTYSLVLIPGLDAVPLTEFRQ